MFLQLQITEIQNVEYMKKTAKGFIIPMETMRRLPARETGRSRRKECLYCGQWTCCSGSSLFFGKGRTDAWKKYSYS